MDYVYKWFWNAYLYMAACMHVYRPWTHFINIYNIYVSINILYFIYKIIFCYCNICVILVRVVYFLFYFFIICITYNALVVASLHIAFGSANIKHVHLHHVYRCIYPIKRSSTICLQHMQHSFLPCWDRSTKINNKVYAQ